jgi:hypothetical protein
MFGLMFYSPRIAPSRNGAVLAGLWIVVIGRCS